VFECATVFCKCLTVVLVVLLVLLIILFIFEEARENGWSAGRGGLFEMDCTEQKFTHFA
jgi:hypothetical protein